MANWKIHGALIYPLALLCPSILLSISFSLHLWLTLRLAALRPSPVFLTLACTFFSEGLTLLSHSLLHHVWVVGWKRKFEWALQVPCKARTDTHTYIRTLYFHNHILLLPPNIQTTHSHTVISKVHLANKFEKSLFGDFPKVHRSENRLLGNASFNAIYFVFTSQCCG